MDASPDSRCPAAHARRLPPLDRRVVLLALALALLMTVVALVPARRLPPGSQFLGVPHVDQLVYYAAAREIFEGGNGFFYANPFDSRADSPRIYTHLGFIVIGLLLKAGLSIAATEIVLRLVGGTAMLLLAAIVLRCALPPSPRPLRLAFSTLLLAGSGITWLLGIFVSLLHAAVGDISIDSPRDALALFFDTFIQLQGGFGHWHLNVIHNLLLTNEVIYHILFYSAVLMLLLDRRRAALALVCLTWWAHPFTGVQLGLIAMVYLACEAAVRRDRRFARAAAAALAINALFLGYYFIFLGRFEEHRMVAEQMRRIEATPMLFDMWLPAWGLLPVLTLLAWTRPAIRRAWYRRPAERLMTVWLIVSFALVYHYLLPVQPTQPMHFTRGHIFFPLVYFSSLLVRDVWRRLRPRTPRLADTFIYFAWLDRITVSSPSYAVDARTADLLRRLDVIEPPMTFASVSGPHADDVSRLIPALTRHRSLVGHHMNVPDLERKEAWQARALERCDREALRQWGVDGLIVRSEDWDRLQAAAVAAGTPFGPGDRVVIEQDGVLVVLLAQSDQASSSSINLVTNTSVARPGL